MHTRARFLDLMRLASLPDVLQDSHMCGLLKGLGCASTSLNVTRTLSDSIAEDVGEELILHLQHLNLTLDRSFWVVSNMVLELYQAQLYSELLVLGELLDFPQPLRKLGVAIAWSPSPYLAVHSFFVFVCTAEEDMDAGRRIRTEDRSVQVYNDSLFVEFCARSHICDLASGDSRSEMDKKVDLEIGDQVDPQGMHQSSALPPDTSTGSTDSLPHPV
jgi:hypothetical protein